MADTPVTTNQAFLDWLNNTPAALVKFVQIVKAFYEMQGETHSPEPNTAPEGPIHVRPDQPPTVHLEPITAEDLDLMMEDRADAQVKERAIKMAKAFLASFMFRGI